jgi:short subunit dehydrogenase-like uncharacterized protein
MPSRLMLYGATGYTGSLLARSAAARRLSPILAGRSALRLEPLALDLGLEHRVVGLDGVPPAEALRDVCVLVNAAGPFSRTADALADACIRDGVHYLDIGGELPVFERLHARDASARARGVMVMPGVGLVVVASDCLAAHVARRLPDAQRLRIAISRIEYLSRGSAKTVMDLVDCGVAVRRNGVMTIVPVGSLDRPFDYGAGQRASTVLTAPDVLTAFLTTGIPDVEVYFEATALDRATSRALAAFAGVLRTPPWQALVRAQAELLPDGPSPGARAAGVRTLLAEAENLRGEHVRSRLRTPDGYTLTVETALAIAERTLAGDVAPGFQTPARVFGPDFVLQFDRVTREDVSCASG